MHASVSKIAGRAGLLARRTTASAGLYGSHRRYYTTDPKPVRKNIPPPHKGNLVESYNNLFVHTYARPDPVFVRGENVYMYDVEGKKYMDFTAGIAVNALGHSDPEWVEAVRAQAGTITHMSNLYHNEPAIMLAHALVNNSSFDRVFFANSGTEANEAALKFARKWAKSVDPSGQKTEYIAFTHGFSGRSMGALSCTHKAKYREPYHPLIPGVHFAEFNDLESVKKVISDRTCAVIVEPVQGEGGITPATTQFMHGLGALCDKHRVLMIADEVQCGIGRTGRLWAHEMFGSRPDIMTLAKPLAGGLPIGATLCVEEVAKEIHPGDHGSTFAGGPLVCAVAKSVFDRISQESFLQSVRAKGDYMLQRVKAMKTPHIKEVRTAGGLFIGVEFFSPVKPIVEKAMERGLLLVSAGEHVLRLCPPLIISEAQIGEAMDIIEDSVRITLG